MAKIVTAKVWKQDMPKTNTKKAETLWDIWFLNDGGRWAVQGTYDTQDEAEQAVDSPRSVIVEVPLPEMEY